jgi:hypothetical protein
VLWAEEGGDKKGLLPLTIIESASLEKGINMPDIKILYYLKL